ncbi:MAG: hypothetical protein VKI63_04290 [Cyanobium sp.]|nr:hypothetical protein [Cyanobium sp.]
MLPTLPHHWIAPLEGLERDHQHRYRLGDHTFRTSITGVLASQKGAYARQRIEDTREQWEDRGNTCHRALELAATCPGWHPDDWPHCWRWIDWIEPLLAHELWSQGALIASEMGVYSLALDLAGTFDGAIAFPSPGGGWRQILFDLKSQGNAKASTYDTRPQLGGYITLAAEHGLHFDGAATIWARPGRCTVKLHERDECLTAWAAAWSSYQQLSAQVARAQAAGVRCDPRFDPFSL